MQQDSTDNIKSYYFEPRQKKFLRLEIASATGKQLNIFIHSAIFCWNNF